MSDDNPQKVQLPPYRQFEVIRYSRQSGGTFNLTTDVINAHVLQYTGRGQVLLFLDYRYVTRYDEQRNPIETVAMELQRVINGYEDVREVNVPNAATSSLLTH